MRLRFSIRDLLWLTALVAVLLGWWLDHRSWTTGRYTIRQIPGKFPGEESAEVTDQNTGMIQIIKPPPVTE